MKDTGPAGPAAPWTATAAWPPRPLGRDLTRDAGDLLWSAPSVLRASRTNSAAVLAAIRETLARERPLRGDEAAFVDLAASAPATAPDAWHHVWGDPQAYHWTRVAHGLLRACLLRTAPEGPAASAAANLAEPTPQRALARHLDRFQAFPLGAALRAGTDTLRFTRPLRDTLPLAIPGTRWSLDGAGTVALRGLVHGRLAGDAAGEAFDLALAAGAQSPSGAIVLRECPAVRHAGFELPLHPHGFRVPGIDFAGPAISAGLEFHERHADLVRRTLESVERHAPDAFGVFRSIIRRIALKPLREGRYDDFSEPGLPGSFVASVIGRPIEMGDHFIHELQHNRLSLVEESGPLFQDGVDEPRHYSPWRDKPRGLYGIFHGVYVFVGVHRYWRSAFGSGVLPADERAYAADRLLRLPRQLALAVAVLRREARLTPLGAAVFDALRRDVDAIRAAPAPRGLPDDAPALAVSEDGAIVPVMNDCGRLLSVRQSIREHLARNLPQAAFEGLLREAEGGAAGAGSTS